MLFEGFNIKVVLTLALNKNIRNISLHVEKPSFAKKLNKFYFIKTRCNLR